MIYIHKLESTLSSIFRLQFFLASAPQSTKYHGSPASGSMTKNSHFARAFTLIELIVVLGIIAILMSMVYPTYTSISERAKATKDMSNLRQIGLGMQTYLNDSDQILPASTTWPGTAGSPVIYPKYIATRTVFQSPFDKRNLAGTDMDPVSYSINTNMFAAAPGISRNMLKVVSPASTFLMAPNYPTAPGDPRKPGSWPGNFTSAPDLPLGGAGETRGTHNNGTRINVLFCDLHLETVTFGPATAGTGTFQDATKHWDPAQ